MTDGDFSWIESLPDAILVVDPDCSIVRASAVAERLFHYERGALTGQKLDALMAEKHREQVPRMLEEALAEADTRTLGADGELHGLTSDGDEMPIEILLGPSGNGARTIAVVRAIAPQVRAREELRKSEQRFRLAAEASSDIIQYLNIEKDLLVIYTDLDCLLGYELSEFPQTLTGWLKLVHPDDVARIESDMERASEDGWTRWDFRYRIRAKDGTWRHWRDRGAFTGFIDGRPNEGIGAAIDETKEVASRQELEGLKDRLQAESDYLQDEIRGSNNFEEIIGSSAPMTATLHKVEQVAATDATVVLLGETGTGKELVARAIHNASRRSGRPLIKVDCTTFPPGLVESELFGHEKGAFTGAHAAKSGRFELADGGTIFLDEIGDLPFDLQGKLLRVIQEGEIQRIGSSRVQRVNVRIVAATNRDLRGEMEEGRFRSDLYYRLNVFPIEIPPLRSRREDIPLLAYYFVAKHASAMGSSVDRIPSRVLSAFVAYDWPGNVRELQNVIERALILSRGRDLVLTEDFKLSRAAPQDDGGSLKNRLGSIERQKILEARVASEWRIKGEGNAASRLGLKPSTLRSRIEALGIHRPA